jgi:oligosaccharyltransferase complex subunit beta
MKLSSLIIGLLGLVSLVIANSSSGNSVLVVLEPSLRREEFSIFFGDLEGMSLDSCFSIRVAEYPALRKRI